MQIRSNDSRVEKALKGITTLPKTVMVDGHTYTIISKQKIEKKWS